MFPTELRIPEKTRRDKKAFLSDQCQEIEENNRMGKTRDQENWRYQGKISDKDGHDKGQKQKDLTEAEEIRKRRQDYSEELYKKGLNDLDNHDGAVTHVELNI